MRSRLAQRLSPNPALMDRFAPLAGVFDVTNPPVKYHPSYPPRSPCLLFSTLQGLTSKQVLDLQAKWGDNRLTPPPETHICIKFILELTDFFSLLLWGGGILCFVGYGLEGAKDNLYLGIVLFFVVLATGIFSFVQNQKSDSLMKSFANMLPPKVLVMRDGKTANEDAVKLVPGDVVLVNAGDLIPADLRILECSDNLTVDNASLTGEAEAQKRSTKVRDCESVAPSYYLISSPLEARI